MASGETVESREDEEQEKKCQQVMELLVAAGYFRARIKGLSNFDKVVGGLVWCLETCNFDVDVDLLFQEDLSIGKKIALTEKIVTVTGEMSCPHAIEPHQIQGLDYIHIYPVVQWLVRRAIETREAQGDSVRRYSLSQFDSHFPSSSSSSMMNQQHTLDVEAVEREYGPKRKYRQKVRPKGAHLETRVNLTLLEYGSKGGKIVSKDENVETLMTDEGSGKLDVSTVTSLVGMRSEELSRAAQHYVKLKEEQDKTDNSPLGLAQAGKKLYQKISALETRIQDMKLEIQEFEPQLEEISGLLDQHQRQLEDVEAQLNSQDLSAEEQELLAKLQALVLKNEQLKVKETEFKATCKEALEELTLRNDNLASKLDQNVEQEDEDEDVEKLTSLRTELATTSQAVNSLERHLDAVPSRHELAQYQRRFVELDNQALSEYSETQRFVTLFNTLQDQKTFMDKEAKLLNSILDSIPDAKMASSSSKQQFVVQLERLLQGVNQAKGKAQQLLREQQEVNEMANNELAGLVEQQRTYSLLVRDMREEMRRNEILTGKLAASAN